MVCSETIGSRYSLFQWTRDQRIMISNLFGSFSLFIELEHDFSSPLIVIKRSTIDIVPQEYKMEEKQHEIFFVLVKIFYDHFPDAFLKYIITETVTNKTKDLGWGEVYENHDKITLFFNYFGLLHEEV